MLQKGVVPGGTGPVNIDDLHYSYGSLSNPYTNKLTKVVDSSPLAATNGMFGDFKDGTNSGDDYIYDDNGNLVIDLNKNAINAPGGLSTTLGTSGIIYNFLDKPEVIRIPGKGTINIVYDADGNKLQRTYTPETGTAVTTSYVNEFVYKGDVLQYINFEEGRIRVTSTVSTNNGFDGLAIDGNMDLSNGKRGAYDYFVRDYQQNVRMILTEETHTGLNDCTMENARAANEEPVFGQNGSANEVFQTRFAISGIPGQTTGAGWHSNASSSVSKLSKLTGHTIGPNSLLKVMAGDVINGKADYYYPAAVNNNSNSLVNDIVTVLAQVITNSPLTPAPVHGNTGNITSNLTATGNPFASITDPNQYTGDHIPRAYLNIVFFDERFNFVQEGSTAIRVNQPGDGAQALVLPMNTKAPKNGYAYIYLSNENDDAVYFDNFTVSDTRGRIIEEDHYYAFGLKIAGISSKKLGDPNEGLLDNKNLYNDKELFDDADLDWYDYGFRNYDPQIGRFPQLDPLTDDYPELTNYQYASNDPIANVDVDGLEGVDATVINKLLNSAGDAVVTHQSVLTEIAVKGVKHASTSFLSVTGSFFKGLGKDIWGAVKGVGQAVAHLDKTVSGIATLATTQGAITAGIAAYQAGSAKIGQFKKGNGNVRAEMIGAGVGEIFQLFGGEVAEAGKLGEVAKLAEVSEDVEKVAVAAKGVTQVEQYALSAAEDGFYPVMKRGFANPQELSWLNKGDLWKFGTTKNPLTRYSQSFLDNTGAGLRYTTEFSGTLKQATTLERMKILNFRGQNGFLPAGNKIVR